MHYMVQQVVKLGHAKFADVINTAILAIQPKSRYDEEFLKQWLRKEKLKL